MLKQLAVAVAALALASPAHADNDSYLADVYKYGTPPLATDPVTLIALGEQTCSDARGYLQAGVQPQKIDLKLLIASNWPNFPYGRSATAIVNSALDNLCPEISAG